jgi:hypothetical protein
MRILFISLSCLVLIHVSGCNSDHGHAHHDKKSDHHKSID